MERDQRFMSSVGIQGQPTFREILVSEAGEPGLHPIEKSPCGNPRIPDTPRVGSVPSPRPSNAVEEYPALARGNNSG